MNEEVKNKLEGISRNGLVSLVGHLRRELIIWEEKRAKLEKIAIIWQSKFEEMHTLGVTYLKRAKESERKRKAFELIADAQQKLIEEADVIMQNLEQRKSAAETERDLFAKGNTVLAEENILLSADAEALRKALAWYAHTAYEYPNRPMAVCSIWEDRGAKARAALLKDHHRVCADPSLPKSGH